MNRYAGFSQIYFDLRAGFLYGVSLTGAEALDTAGKTKMF